MLNNHKAKSGLSKRQLIEIIEEMDAIRFLERFSKDEKHNSAGCQENRFYTPGIRNLKNTTEKQ